ISTSPTLSLSLSSGNTGLTRQGTSLLIDINKDGIARATDDIVISDFFGASATVEGVGFIENVGNLAGSEILAANLTEATSAPGSSATSGTPGNDNLIGTSADDNIAGLEGNDTISGLDGNDTLLGDAGNNNLSGGGGNDSLVGKGSSDTLDGGIG
ncbi:calcium-binding protein, partial [Microcoleus anatoxicus]|uniref:calcium-binding protein n=1 Tax=Microcoleus anatoxicus TaxID=2705319 RepID=UPI0030C945BC